MQIRTSGAFFCAGALAFTFVAIASRPGAAATLCVNQSGGGKCFRTIQAAVNAANAHDTIDVSAGVYQEGVVIGKPLSLIARNAEGTVIDATGQPNGIYVDGLDNPGLSNVRVANFKIRFANFEGILATNMAHLDLLGNDVHDNDKALTPSGCTGLPIFETDEGEDCGEGIHIMGVANSTLSENISERNSGGILISDDTGRTRDNLINNNIVRNNPFDCGITLASHAPALGSNAPHNGIFRNQVIRNHSDHNGLQQPGAGAGVGIFSDGTGKGINTGNIVADNVLMNNGLPGFAMHSHVPGDDLNDNVIVENRIGGNGPDEGDTVTAGPTGININSGFGGTHITGTVVSQNIISNEVIDIAVNTPARVDVHNNNLLGAGQIGVDNIGTGVLEANLNWWGCAAGPSSPACSQVSGPKVTFKPWLHMPAP